MSLLEQYDLARLTGVAIIGFVFLMTILKVVGLPGLSYQEFSLFLKLAGVLLGGHELVRLKQRHQTGEGSLTHQDRKIQEEREK